MKKFQRTKEDFTCDICHAYVQGDGYTNHCPKCLWSKHVDVNPGDRAASCGGSMRPTAVEQKGDSYILTHTCTVCGHTKRNSMSDGDDFDAVLHIMQNL